MDCNDTMRTATEAEFIAREAKRTCLAPITYTSTAAGISVNKSVTEALLPTTRYASSSDVAYTG